MERFLRPERFDGDPNSPTAETQWLHWKRTFDSFLTSLEANNSPNKLDVLINFVSDSNYAHISECKTYDEAVTALKGLFVKKKNKVFARYKLNTRKQQPGESLDEFVQQLKLLAKSCSFKATTVEQNTSNYLVDALIAGINNNSIRQRLLEQDELTFDAAYKLAQSLDFAMKNSESFSSNQCVSSVPVETRDNFNEVDLSQSQNLSAAPQKSSSNFNQSQSSNSCPNCGGHSHPKSRCPARDKQCFKCNTRGHFSNVCRKSKHQTAALVSPYLASLYSSEGIASGRSAQSKKSARVTVHQSSSAAGVTSSYSPKVIIDILLAGEKVKALTDTGATKSFIDMSLVQRLGLKQYPSTDQVSLASGSYSPKVMGQCYVDITFKGQVHERFNFTILQQLVAPVILGGDFMAFYKSVTFEFDGDLPGVTLATLTPMKMEPVKLYNISPEVTPVATKSRRFSSRDQKFIRQEVKKLLENGVIEESTSPWRAQVHVVREENHKTRMVVDYSRTINRFTALDAYPMKRIDGVVDTMSKYLITSSRDLKDAYHQLYLSSEDKELTAFEADGKLYHFLRLPFGLRNAVAGFQRTIDKFIEDNKLEGVHSYVDNIYIGGNSQEEHDANLQRLLDAAAKYNLTFNEGKTTLPSKTLDILGYRLHNGNILPDPSRVQPLLDLPVPKDSKALKRAIGMFAYYSKYIPKFSDRISPLVKVSNFPLSETEEEAFSLLKKTLATAALGHIDENLPFVLETDASNIAVSATLNQDGRPVAFYSRTFQGSELGHSSVEKEAQAIVEGVRKWDYLLLGRDFTIITDQKPVSFLFDQEHSSVIKNAKLFRWRLELSQYQYNIVYRPGKENVAADMFSRAYCSSIGTDGLVDLHDSLYHPGITRMLHLVRTRNLPHSVEDVRRVSQSCKVCAELKPQFYNPGVKKLVKATRPMERLNLDFKGPLPSSSRNRYILTVIDEYSRFPWAFPCADISTKTVIKCLDQLFAIFGMPSYVHSDRGSQFMSKELKQYLHSRGVVTSRTTAYNPQGNGQCERFNGTIWRTVLLGLKTHGLQVSQWESVLTDALHSIRSLLCTATNSTPHDRMFSHARRSCSGTSIPSWLASPGPVLLKRQVRLKNDPLCDEVFLLEANPQYAHVRLQDGRETTVSLRHLAPSGSNQEQEPDLSNVFQDIVAKELDSTPLPEEGDGTVVPGQVMERVADSSEAPAEDQACAEGMEDVTPLRRSSRSTRGIPPSKLNL